MEEKNLSKSENVIESIKSLVKEAVAISSKVSELNEQKDVLKSKIMDISVKLEKMSSEVSGFDPEMKATATKLLVISGSAMSSLISDFSEESIEELKRVADEIDGDIEYDQSIDDCDHEDNE